MHTQRLPKQCHNLKFTRSIKRWDEAIMLGNGHIGCLIWGESDQLRLSLDRSDLWDKTPYPGVLEKDFTYKKLVELAKNKQTDAIRAQFDAPYYNPTPTKLPAGKIFIHFEAGMNVVSELDLATATAQLQIGNHTQLKSYLHATELTGFIQIAGPTEGITLQLENPKFGKIEDTSNYHYDAQQRSISHGDLEILKYESPLWHKESHLQYFTQKIDETLTYGILMATKNTTTGLEIAYRVVTQPHSQETNWLEQEKQLLLHHLHMGFEIYHKSHTAWWENFWNKSSISLPDAYFEKNWYLTNYFLGSASRKGAMPMPLQGVWTADDGKLPPWKGDYHNDLNTQMTYYHYLKANHLEEGESFIDFLWNLVPKAREFAKSFYGTEGICLPAVMAIDGTALGGWPMYSLSPTQHLWLCQAFERHYRFTGDKDFLKEKAYPFLEESAKCILGILEENEEGLLMLPASSSAEIHDDTAQAWLTPNSNYDLSLIIYLFTQLHQLSEELHNGQSTKWQAILDKLPKLAVNAYNVLMLSPDESLMESHRHLAHAMPIHPLRLMDYEDPTNRKVIDATISNLELLGYGQWVGFSFTWFAELFAIQGNGEGAHFQLKLFWENLCSPNGFHLNGDYKNRGLTQSHYRPFTLESNFCAADALQEMLLQTDYHKIDLFPALPAAWQEETVSFEDLRGEKGILISAALEKGKVTHIILKPQHEGTYVIKANIDQFTVEPACPYTQDGKLITFILSANTTYTIKS